ncbi:hypothetical protein KUV28_03395 [Ferrimonas balearica]|nr:hypothetical protein [Ferrimonas balearica]
MPHSALLLHTAEVHVATFDALRDEIAPGLGLRHAVRPDWLARVRAGEDLSEDMAALAAKAEGGFLCTCTTLGPLAERLGGMRVDRPMMRDAARIGGQILMAYVLDSTRAPSLDLLQSMTDGRSTIRTLPLPEAWPLFEAGETARFHALVAGALRAALAERGADVVVLAQASMAGAAPLLEDLGLPVLTSPRQAMLALAEGLGPT